MTEGKAFYLSAVYASHYRQLHALKQFGTIVIERTA